MSASWSSLFWTQCSVQWFSHHDWNTGCRCHATENLAGIDEKIIVKANEHWDNDTSKSGKSMIDSTRSDSLFPTNLTESWFEHEHTCRTFFPVGFWFPSTSNPTVSQCTPFCLCCLHSLVELSYFVLTVMLPDVWFWLLLLLQSLVPDPRVRVLVPPASTSTSTPTVNRYGSCHSHR